MELQEPKNIVLESLGGKRDWTPLLTHSPQTDVLYFQLKSTQACLMLVQRGERDEFRLAGHTMMSKAGS